MVKGMLTQLMAMMILFRNGGKREIDEAIVVESEAEMYVTCTQVFNAHQNRM